MELRAGYKHTEVGGIPEEWGVRQLGELCSKITDGTHDTPVPVRSGRPFLTAIHIKENWVDFDNCLYLSEIDHRAIFARCNPQRGDVLMVNIGAGVATTALVDVDFEFSLKNVALLKPDPNRLTGLFLNFALNRRKPEITQALSSGGAQPFLSLTQIGQIKVPIPSKDEQRAIATALSDVDALITGLEQLIAKKRDLKQAAMQQLLTGQTRLPGFSGAWEVKRLGDVADVIDPHPSHRAPDEVANGVPFVGIGDLDEGGSIVGKKVRLVSAMVLEEHATRYDLNDELIGLGRVASIGKVVALRKHTDGYAISPTLGVIRGREAKRSYLLYALKSKFVTEQFAKIMSGSTRSSVGMEVLRLLQILLPPNEQEQTAIAAVLSDMDAELAALEARLAKSRAIKQGMMQELLTGRTRLV